MLLQLETTAQSRMRNLHGRSGEWMHGYDAASAARGNRELTDELRAKAGELEKVFAEHMQRVCFDLIAYSQRRPEGDITMKGSSNGVETGHDSMLDMESYQCFGQPDHCRGELYEMYMRKRDAKLRKEWGLKKAQKEAETKAMQENLERTWAEMKLKFRRYVDGEDSASCAGRRAEQLRSFSVSRRNAEEIIESIHSKEEDKLHNSTPIHTKKLLSSSRSMSSSMARTSGAPLPRPSARVTSSASTNPIKENTKPMAPVGKATTQGRAINFARSKSTNEGINLIKEVKPQMSQPLRKRSAVSDGLKDVSPLNSNGYNLSRFCKEESEPNIFTKTQKDGEFEPFLRKGSGIGPGAGPSLAALRTSMASDMLEMREESQGLARADGEFERAPTDRRYSRSHHRSFSYSHEALDMDVSVDSPRGSVASWNSQPKNQAETRTRKKWGPVQQPVLVADASQQSRKDAAKGFMQSLKFGRKSSRVAEIQ